MFILMAQDHEGTKDYEKPVVDSEGYFRRYLSGVLRRFQTSRRYGDIV